MKRARQLVLIASLALAAFGGGGCGDDVEPGGETYSFVFNHLRFGRVLENGTVEGVNIDGRVSERGDEATCGASDVTAPNGEVGIDNHLARVLPFIDDAAGGDPDGLIQGAVNDGSLLLVLEVMKVNDLQNDDHVEVQLHVGTGEPLVGASGALLPYQSFRPNPDYPSSAPGAGRIRDGRLTAGPVSALIPIAILNVAFDLSIGDGQVDIQFDEEGNGDGYLGGAVPRETFHDVVTAAVNGNADEAAPLISIVNNLADLELVGDRCTKVSAGLGVGAVPAFFVRPDADAGP